MKFNDVLYNMEGRFSLGVEEESERLYLSIPVSNGDVDYEEYYEIDTDAFECYQNNVKCAYAFAEKCRKHEKDELLIIKPSRQRGVPM